MSPVLGLGRLARRRRQRDSARGSGQPSRASGSDELADVMASSDVADFIVETEDRALADIALEVLTKAHWIDAD